MSMLKFEDTNQNGESNKIVEKMRNEFIKELTEKKSERINYAVAQNVALGCTAECFFCGARCCAINSCKDNNREHKSNYHRPMAFKGTYETRKDGTKYLVKDFCTSDFNLNKSKWVDLES